MYSIYLYVYKVCINVTFKFPYIQLISNGLVHVHIDHIE